jgi:imidazolonepropionase-like amidohydrolase
MLIAPRAAVFAGRIFDGEALLPRGVDGLLVENGRIVAIGPRSRFERAAETQFHDLGDDATIIPGLIDAHVHFFGVDSAHIETLHSESNAYRGLRAGRDAATLLYSGYTSVRELGSSIGPSVARAIREGVIVGPLVVPAGQFVCSSRGTWSDLAEPSGALERSDLFADGVDACRAIVRRRVMQGAQVIKIGTSVGLEHDHFLSWGDRFDHQKMSYSLEEIQAICDEAHSLGLKVSAHSIGVESVTTAILGGVDVIEHGHAINDEVRALMVERGTVLIPTLSHSQMLIRSGSAAGVSPETVKAAENHFPRQLEDFRAAVEANVIIAAGSDRIGPSWAPFHETALELVLMAENGMTALQALRASTSVAARVLGIERERGQLATGKAADLVVFAGDPTSDIRAAQWPVFVMQDGHVRRNDVLPH